MYGDDLPAAVGPSGTTNQFGIGAEKLWNDNLTGSSSIVVGILDEGVQVTHPDLINNMWVNPYEVPDDGIDNDANGYVDDVHGWDFVNNDKTVYDAGQDSHGTHVAGTIGGEGRNGVGVAGVNWDVTMISLKFLGPDGGTTSAAVRALDYLTDLKVRHGMNIVASNNSWGGGGYSAALHAAINRAAKQNILFVAAAGNSTANNDTTASYPSNYDSTQASPGESAASYDSVIAVASITNTGGLSSFSNFGATQVDIGAPGSGIWSTVPENSYSSFSGTSMATPHVTGAVALYAAAQGRTVSGAEIRSAILETAVPTASLAGRTVTGGRLNVAAAVSRSSLFDFDQKEYAIPATVGLSLFDAAANRDSAAVETITVSVRGTTETTGESVTLTETNAGSGRFTGTIELATGNPIADGRLQVVHGDVLTATYGARNQVATAKVDGLAPQISGLAASPLAINATVSWSTDEPATAEVFYGLTPESLLQRVASTSPKTAHELTLTGLVGQQFHDGRAAGGVAC
jgi:subtilisin family serine protease